MGSEARLIKADGAYQINYSEELIEMRKEFLEYAKIELPFGQLKSLTFMINEMIGQAIEDGASQGFDRGYAEALKDTWTLEQNDDIVRIDNQTYLSPADKITLTTSF